MRVTIKTEAYDKDTLKKPWIAVRRNTPKGTSDLDFFSAKFAGEEGEAGEVSINCKAGDVVSTGNATIAEDGGPSQNVKHYIVNDDGEGGLTAKRCSMKEGYARLRERVAEGGATPFERYRSAAYCHSLMSSYGLSAHEVTEEGVAELKAGLGKKKDAGADADADAGADADADDDAGDDADQGSGPAPS